ncbi:hypothetical protein CSC43_1950 [Pseudomonas aeruginosa]|nr:hypothetical protein CSB94_4345 [Pseudomonas aeruginosa]EFQ37694.1 hypothetical protein PA39016_000350013 [Pseudomonas aeruginosa 39016]BAK89112.1 hypothetical protein NCGM2_2254 [Pseudomonas aeruginosa NCGM2.S1]AVK10008.1 hypothetical protein CSB91_2032 [Pseudomonas aeruginosa]QEN57359.1 Uncharacterized protein PAT23_3728 [Pseudomonas aeruginosa]
MRGGRSHRAWAGPVGRRVLPEGRRPRCHGQAFPSNAGRRSRSAR